MQTRAPHYRDGHLGTEADVSLAHWHTCGILQLPGAAHMQVFSEKATGQEWLPNDLNKVRQPLRAAAPKPLAAPSIL